MHTHTLTKALIFGHKVIIIHLIVQGLGSSECLLLVQQNATSSKCEEEEQFRRMYTGKSLNFKICVMLNCSFL